MNGRIARIAHLVDVVLLGEVVEPGVCLVKHIHHLHGRNFAAYFGEVDYVREENRH